MGVVLGYKCKLYLDTAESYVTPTWAEIKNVRDLTQNLEKADADVTTRATNGWRAKVGTLKDGSFDFENVWDTSDPHFAALMDSFLNGTAIHMAVMDGVITTPGTQGLAGWFEVMKLSRKEALEDAVKADVTINLTYFPAEAPTWLVVAP